MITHKHHIIPRHEWKVRFGNLRGFNDKDNYVWLTLEQHIEVHKRYYDDPVDGVPKLGDKLAYQFLSGRIGKEEVLREISRENQKKSVLYWKIHPRKPWSHEAKLARSIMLKGNQHTKGRKLTKEHIQKCTAHAFGNKYNLGRKHTEETKKKIAISGVGRTLSLETKQKISLAAKKKWKLWKDQHRGTSS